MHCTSLFKYIFFKMGNILSYCIIISKPMYQLLLHKMTQVRMKIIKKFLEEDPKAPFNHNCLRYYYTIKFKHPTYTLYAHVHIGTKFAKIFTNYMENPAVPPFLRNIPTPPPPQP